MKILKNAFVLGMVPFLVHAHPHDGNNVKNDDFVTTSQKWQECMINKEGWIEGGAEWLYMTSDVSPLFTSVSTLAQGDSSLPRVREKSLNPEFNSGFACFLRYRPMTDNDLTLKYSYIHNKGDGEIQSNQAYEIDQGGVAGIPPTPYTIDQNDKGYQTNHTNIFDLLVGRTYPLTYQSMLRLAGGLSYNTFNLYFQFSDHDQSIEFRDGQPNRVDRQAIFSKRTHKLWGLGPKGEVDFEFCMLPSAWTHNLNFYLNSQFALLYAKGWSYGKLVRDSFSQDGANPPTTILRNLRWSRGAAFHLIPVINLDFGLKYAYESTFNNLIFKLAAGYRLYSYWNFDNVFLGKDYAGGTDENDLFINFFQDEHLIYTGPYIRFSIAY